MTVNEGDSAAFAWRRGEAEAIPGPVRQNRHTDHRGAAAAAAQRLQFRSSATFD